MILWLRLSLWMLIMGLCAALMAHTPIRTDLSAFLPQSPSLRQQWLIEQLQEGQVARLVMIAIGGADGPTRARLSQALETRLRAQGLFDAVENGSAMEAERDRAYVMEHRYLLHGTPGSHPFDVAELHRDMLRSLTQLSGNEGWLFKPLFVRDPTGTTLDLLEQTATTEGPRRLNGVWVSSDGRRTLLLALTHAPGTDTDGQQQALRSIRQNFADLSHDHPTLRLDLSGAAVFAVASRQAIETQATRLAGASMLLVIGLLGFVYRSPRLLLIGLFPVFSGALVGMAAVALAFGDIHGLTLGFGTTLIGEAVDYAIYFYLQRSSTIASRPFWRTLALGTATSMAGFATLLASGFPGLMQLGLYSLSGLLTANIVTRWILPGLVRDDQRPSPPDAWGASLERGLTWATRLRWLPWLLASVALGIIVQHRALLWNNDPSALSAVSQPKLDLDRQLRHDLGAADTGLMVVLTAPTREGALTLAEQLTPLLDGWVHEGTLAGYDNPAAILPSLARQRERQQAIPDAIEARQHLKAALEGTPIDARALEPFLHDLETTRHAPLLQRKDLDGTSWGLLFDTLLVQHGNHWQAFLPLHFDGNVATPDAAALERTLNQAGSPALVLDLAHETRAVFTHYRERILQRSMGGMVAIGLMLLIVLRSGPRMLRILAPLMAAVLVDVAVLLVADTPLTLLHLVGLLLVVAIGSNYALFFEGMHAAPSSPERQKTCLSLLTANLTTVGGFGILATSPILVLSALGTTVSLGTLLAFLFSALTLTPSRHP